MWLKVVIVLLFVALVISLFSSLAFLMKDRGNDSRRTWNALSVRLVLAGLLIALLVYGVFTGQLRSNAPWDTEKFAPAAAADPTK